MAEVRLSNLFY